MDDREEVNMKPLEDLKDFQNTHHWGPKDQLTPDSVNPRGPVKVTSEVKVNTVSVNDRSSVLPTDNRGSKP